MSFSFWHAFHYQGFSTRLYRNSFESAMSPPWPQQTLKQVHRRASFAGYLDQGSSTQGGECVLARSHCSQFEELQAGCDGCVKGENRATVWCQFTISDRGISTLKSWGHTSVFACPRVFDPGRGYEFFGFIFGMILSQMPPPPTHQPQIYTPLYIRCMSTCFIMFPSNSSRSPTLKSF